ncbi:MAG TPA: hypothetical protein VL993_00315 [Stellaceae bacterium]|nr:hypothetical protein [Stellaceae bacterium]
MPWSLNLFADRLASNAALELAAGPVRALYVEEGGITLASAGAAASLAPNSAWHGAAAASLAAGAPGARLLRFELCDGTAPADRPLLAAALALDRDSAYLMRCDRVEFPPGGVAYHHTHQGPGVRCLVAGSIRIDSAGASHAYAPGQAWFESGPDTVFAAASPDAVTAFIRVMILPAACRGRSSIRYVRAEDQDKSKPQRYQIYIDQPIALPGSPR